MLDKRTPRWLKRRRDLERKLNILKMDKKSIRWSIGVSMKHIRIYRKYARMDKWADEVDILRVSIRMLRIIKGSIVIFRNRLLEIKLNS